MFHFFVKLVKKASIELTVKPSVFFLLMERTVSLCVTVMKQNVIMSTDV